MTSALCAGGTNDGGNVDETEGYDGTAWSAEGTLLTARRHAAGAGARTAALQSGGESGTRQMSEEYDGTAWAATSDMVLGCFNSHGGGVQGAAFAAGSETDATTMHEYRATIYEIHFPKTLSIKKEDYMDKENL
jgi:phosphotransferase system  glucose/maltose/N-acetylglucosamine-specific IIC component